MTMTRQKVLTIGVFTAQALAICFISLSPLRAQNAQPTKPMKNSVDNSVSPQINLLDADLSRWYKWLGVPHFSVKGLPAGTQKGDGLDGIPLGRKDPLNVFKIATLDGEKVLSISGEIHGGLITSQEYENYHLRAEYKWGEKKYLPRPLTRPRDSGILFHLTGTNEDAYWSAFMMGLEFQVSEATTADLLFMGNKNSTVIPVVDGRAFENSEGNRWDTNLPFKRVGGVGSDPKFRKSENYESPPTDWTTVEIYTVGSTGVYLVNGHVVNAFRNAGVPQPDKTIKPLTKGKIQIQSEGAEVYYRNISIQSISEIPADIRKTAGLD